MIQTPAICPAQTPAIETPAAVRPSFKPIEVSPSEVAFRADGKRHAFSRVRLPESFMEWMLEGRRAMYDRLEGKGSASFFGTHLPVVVTWCRHEPFPFNSGNKGVGLVPVADKLAQYSDLYEHTFESCRDIPWQESLPQRLAAVRRLLSEGDVSDRMLASLEIFEKRTFGNICDFPIATLHYTGSGPVYRSFQINTVVEVVPMGEPAHRFAFWSRRLFEYDSFHITQTKFPYAYVFHPVEVRDKTPKRRD